MVIPAVSGRHSEGVGRICESVIRYSHIQNCRSPALSSPAHVIQITEIESWRSHTEPMDRRLIPFFLPMEHNMNTRRHELSNTQNTVELAVAELDEVRGGRRAIEGEIQYLNW